MVVLAPAAVWDRGRELLKPFAGRFADATAMLVLLGYPTSVDLQQAMNRGLASIVSADPTLDEVFLAGMRAFELLEAKGRAETRGKWVNRYRYELGELIEISRALTTERDDRTSCSASSSRRAASSPAPTPGQHLRGRAPGRAVAPHDARRTAEEHPRPDVAVQADAERLGRNSTRASSSMPMSSARSISGSGRALASQAINIGDVVRSASHHASSAFDRIASTTRSVTARRSMLTAPLDRQAGTTSSACCSSSTRSATRRRSVSSSRRGLREADVIPFDERSEELLGDAGLARRHRPRKRASLRREIKHLFEGFVTASVSAIESARPDHQRSLAPRRRPDRRTSPSALDSARAPAPYKRGDVVTSRATCARSSSRALLHDFGKIGVKRAGAREGEEALPRRASITIRARIDFVDPQSLEADDPPRGSCEPRSRSGASGADLAELDTRRETPHAARSSRPSWSTPSSPPTSRPILKLPATSSPHRGAREASRTPICAAS